MRYKLLITILFFGFIATSCNDYLDVNVNPNGAVRPPLKGLLANVTYNTGVNMYNMGGTTSFYTQYLASPNPASPTDVYERVSTSGTWGSIYGVMSDIYDMEKFAKENNSYHYIGVAKVLMAINLATAVDAYGDVPFSEALSFETIVPKFDSQQELYTKVNQLLDEAIVELGKTNDGEALPKANDFIHGGSVSKWIKTAYTLKARYLNHLSGTPNYNADAVLAAAAKGYTSNADDAQVTQFQQRNPWAQVAVNNANLVLGGWLSEQFIDALNGTTFGTVDPRLAKITSPLPNGKFIGTENGKGRTGDGAGAQTVVYLTTDGFYSSTNAPLIIASFSELKMIEAEANFRAGNTNKAYDALLAGVTANHSKLGVAPEATTSYLASGILPATAADVKLKDIFNQKYITMFLHPESWVDARRFNYSYDKFTLPVNAALGTAFVRRLDYPDTEYQRNAANVPKVDLTTPIFWN
ncbi:Starch-binding associating with outer membrane [Spirosomataceae bacterium TFI 002]|nr:Starch-binding associating with outer membrane [Spirosomataceae bacterium TFI 002]